MKYDHLKNKSKQQEEKPACSAINEKKEEIKKFRLVFRYTSETKEDSEKRI